MPGLQELTEVCRGTDCDKIFFILREFVLNDQEKIKMSEKIYKLDRSSLKFNQGTIVLLVSLAFILDLSWLTALVAVVLLTGTLFPNAGLFKLLYFYIAKPIGIIKPKIIEEDNTRHLFAQGLGGVFLAISFLLLDFTNQQLVGWILSIVVVVLAFVNLTTNFCAGCFLYFQLNKLGVFPRKFSRR